jgi:ribA/ribD-fused uncharacterized protein
MSSALHAKPMHRQGYFLFWGGWPSNWHKAPFVIDGITFNCVEQWMMWSKAVLFGDDEAATKILATKNPRDQKALGRAVRGFEAAPWSACAREIVYRGVLEKFRQNPELCDKLLATWSDTIVEASPEDLIWGIGLHQDDPDATNPSKWRGTNWLGEALMQARDELMRTRG